MIDSAQACTGVTMVAPPLDPTREALAARAVLPHVQNGMRVLDICCGAGWSTLLLAARSKGSARQTPVVAWDPDPAARNAALEHITRANFSAHASVVDTPPSDQSFDLVYLSHRNSLWLIPAITMANACLATGGKIAVALPRESVASAVLSLYQHGFVPMLAKNGAPLLDCSDLDAAGDASAGDVVVIAQQVHDRIGLEVTTHGDQASLLQAFGLNNPGRLLEDDLDTVDNDCERHGRKRRDAEVLCGLAASRPGPCLDLGTSHGRSAFKLATNIGRYVVTTVNMLPEQALAAGVHITHVLPKHAIGSYPRERGIHNIRQLYANTLDWNWQDVPYGLQLAFIDACHDSDAVLADSLQAFRRLRPGGFLVWHDFSPALANVHPWIASCMQGVRRFCAAVQPAGSIQHLLGSWCGVLQKESSDV